MLIAAAVLVVLVGGFFAVQVFQTRAALSTAAQQAEILQQQLVTADSDSAMVTLAALQESTERARSTSDNVMWTVASKVPWWGRNVSAIRTVSIEIDRVADQAAPPVVELAGQVSSKTFSPRDGKVKISAITKAGPAIAEASAALDISRDNLAGVDPGGLAAPLRGPIGTLKDKVGSLAAVSHNADLAAQLLPDMLGANGTRRYFLMNQNNAETRPTGGIVGSYAVITAKKGKLSIGTQGSIQDMLPFEKAGQEADGRRAGRLPLHARHRHSRRDDHP